MPRGLYGVEDWLERSTLLTVQKYASVLCSLGVSEETFRHDRDANDAIELLVTEGKIPRLEASDIVNNAKRFFKKQYDLSTSPLAVFWDAENIPIPTALSGSDVASAIKQAIAPFGQPVVLNAYFDIGNPSSIPQAKRSELQLSGFHLIDTPHLGRKEVADKMIIVDAMMFLLSHATTGATLAFITGDTDYAYMLSRLADLPHVRTILVAQRHSVALLHRSAGSLLSWETDVLANIGGGTTSTPSTCAAAPAPSFASLAVSNTPQTVSSSKNRSGTPDRGAQAPPPYASRPHAVVVATAGNPSHFEESLSMVQAVMKDLADGGTPAPRWQDLSQCLKDRFPLRFKRKEDRQFVIDRAVERGLVGTAPGVNPGQTVYYLRRPQQQPQGGSATASGAAAPSATESEAALMALDPAIQVATA